MPQLTGRVKSLRNPGGFGFIRTEDDKEYFFHRDDFLGFWLDLVTDFESRTPIIVNFEHDKTPKGLRARNVNRVDWPNQAV